MISLLFGGGNFDFRLVLLQKDEAEAKNHGNKEGREH